MVVGYIVFLWLLYIPVGVQKRCCQVLSVYPIKAFLHCSQQQVLFGIGQVPRQTRVAARCLRVGNGANFSLSINSVWADKQLPALRVNHPVGRCTSCAFWPDDLRQIGRDLVQLIRRTKRQVGAVGDHPQPVGPGYNRPRATLTLIVVISQMRINAAKLRAGRMGLGVGRDSKKKQTDGYSDDRREHNSLETR